MKSEKIDYKQIWSLFLKYKWLYVILLPLALAAAYLYLQFAQPKYESKALLLLKENERTKHLSEQSIFAEFGLWDNNKNLENETMVLKAMPALKEVVEKLELQYKYVELDGWKKRELHSKSPVKVLSWQPSEYNSFVEGILTILGDNHFQFVVDKKDIYRGEFGKNLILPEGVVTFTLIQKTKNKNPLEITISPVLDVAESLFAEIEVGILGENSSTIQISYKDVVAERTAAVLEELINRYNKKSVSEKNEIFENTIEMINERIKLINDELSSAESDVEQYKRRFNMVELSTEGTLLLNEVNAQNKEISKLEVEVDILNSVEELLLSNKNDFEFVPSNTNMTNLTLANQLEKFNEHLRERDKLRNELGPSHPELILAEKQLQNLRETIIENIQTIKSDLLLANNANYKLRSSLQKRLKSLPRMERELLEMERQKNIKEDLYLYLLQKREESAISLAITSPTGSVIEPANVPLRPAGPIHAQIWLIAGFLGLFLPTGLAFLSESNNTKIQFERDIKKITKVPVIGALAYSRKKHKDLVVLRNSQSAVTEMFRMLRANLAFIIPGKKLKTLLITSSISSEGKSFATLNLGMTQALAGKKVLILELDLRKPNGDVYKPAKRAKKGVVNYLVNPMVNEKDIITNSGIHPNLDIIYSGPIPPNPNELILSARLSLLVNKMKETYDFILIDAPPVGIVSDALIMNYLADATMFLVRAGLTRKAHLEIIDDISTREKLPRPFIVLNAVRLNRPGGYREGFGASYGKGYGYYRKDKTNIFGRLKLNMKQNKSKQSKNGSEHTNGVVQENGVHATEKINI